MNKKRRRRNRGGCSRPPKNSWKLSSRNQLEAPGPSILKWLLGNKPNTKRPSKRCETCKITWQLPFLGPQQEPGKLSMRTPILRLWTCKSRDMIDLSLLWMRLIRIGPPRKLKINISRFLLLVEPRKKQRNSAILKRLDRDQPVKLLRVILWLFSPNQL